ncbi:MAG: carbohydrate ABC transporter permease [Armatimonadetes bacterium]|nr:carbohydrate ABC transporter permease [Armatimonadota bacterium]
MRYRCWLHALVLYGLLAAGSILFSIPFAWMACSSVKVDRELFGRDPQFLPLAPDPRVRSPYVDERYHSGPGSDKEWEIQGWLNGQVKALGFAPPADIDAESATEQVSNGLLQRLSRRLPAAVWSGPASGIIEAAQSQVDRRSIEEVFASVHRRLVLGQLRIRSTAREEVVLGADLPMSRRWTIHTPTIVSFRDLAGPSMTGLSVAYDFGQGDRGVFSGTYGLPFGVQDFQRLQLYLRPDDTWHELGLSLEMAGVRYVSERAVPLANFGWTLVTWRFPSPEDLPTQIKTWYALREAGRGFGILADPHRVRVTLELRQCSRWRAACNKLRLNYDRVLDHIPFWRYVATSLFLVVLNVVLTLFSCSLVAYAFARLEWPGRAPLWLGHAFGSAFYIFLLRQFLRGIPRDLEDAARIDGCGFFRIYWHIMLPLIKPSLAAIAIFTFMGTWNDFMGPLIYVADQRLYPLAFGLYAFSVQVGNNPALTMAASLLMTLPVIVIFFFAQKYFIQGVTLTGLKG